MKRKSTVRRYQGTMVVRSNMDSMQPITTSSEERRSKRKSKRNRRLTTSAVERVNAAEPTVQQVLLRVLYAVSRFRPMYAENATNTLLSLTTLKKKTLTQLEAFSLEESFNVLYPELDHLFMPWVTEPSLRGRAMDYLDIPFLTDTILLLERNSLADVRGSREEFKEPVTYFLKMVGQKRRLSL